MSVMTTTEKAGYDALVSGAAQALKKDGSVALTADQPMGTHALTGLRAGAAPGESVRYEQMGVANITVADAPTLRAVTPTAAQVAAGTVWLQTDTRQLWTPRSTTTGDFKPWGIGRGDLYVPPQILIAARQTYGWADDFATQIATGTNGALIPGSTFTASLSSSGTLAFNSTGAGNTDTEIGLATFSTGTVSAAGDANILNLGASFNWGTNAACWFSVKVKIPTLSTTAQKWDTHLGTFAAAFAAGVWLSADSDADVRWRLVLKAAGTTTLASAVTITAGQFYHIFVWKDAGTAQVHWAIDGVLQTDPATTNTPLTSTSAPGLDITKSAGTGTAGTMIVDWFDGGYYLPAGRGA